MILKADRFLATVAAGISMIAANVASAGIIETFEAPGVTSSTVKNTETVDFNKLTTGSMKSETVTFSNLTVTYSANSTGNLYIQPADQYGGAPSLTNPAVDTNYLGVHAGDSVTMTLSTPQAYFGLWFSAADQYNDLSFYNGDKLLATIMGTGPVLSALNSSYKGNPTTQFKGKDASENFVFIDFSAQTADDLFNKIVLSNGSGGKTIFESDNHTFSADILLLPASVAEPGESVLSPVKAKNTPVESLKLFVV